MDEIIHEAVKEGRTARLLLHSCCAPCSSYVLEYLSQYFLITAFYYNPNITDKYEYEKRAEELKRLIREQPHLHEVAFLRGEYEPGKFFEAAKGFEGCREGGERCRLCFSLRLRETARIAAEGCFDEKEGLRIPAGSFDFIATTLTISPLKDADVLTEIGEAAAREFGVKYLPSDFKKRGGYQRSIALSGEYGLYRQDYCGCVYSMRHDLDLKGRNQAGVAHPPGTKELPDQDPYS